MSGTRGLFRAITGALPIALILCCAMVYVPLNNLARGYEMSYAQAKLIVSNPDRYKRFQVLEAANMIIGRIDAPRNDVDKAISVYMR